ncbi:MAG: MTH938/NDUFAF3 family protein [Methylophilaceae bacterium]
MKFHKIESDTLNIIDAYDDGWIQIKTNKFEKNIIIFPESIISNSPIQSLNDLSKKNLKRIFSFKPEIVLIGTEKQNFFLERSSQTLFYQKKIAVEGMSLTSACRTFNILLAEQRRVILIIIFGL